MLHTNRLTLNKQICSDGFISIILGRAHILGILYGSFLQFVELHAVFPLPFFLPLLLLTIEQIPKQRLQNTLVTPSTRGVWSDLSEVESAMCPTIMKYYNVAIAAHEDLIPPSPFALLCVTLDGQITTIANSNSHRFL